MQLPRVYPFPFAFSFSLHSPLLAPEPHLIPHSLCQKPLYLHSTSSFHLRQTKCSIAFPSVVMKWEGEETRRGWQEREREEGRQREKKRRNHSHWQLCPETITLFPHLQQVNRQLLLCAYTLPLLSLSLHLWLLLTCSLMRQNNTCTRSQHAHTKRNSADTDLTRVVIHS